MARDVYLLFYDRHKLPIFSNISMAEQRHMDAVKGLLDRYGLADSAAGQRKGKFASGVIAGLYRDADELAVWRPGDPHDPSHMAGHRPWIDHVADSTTAGGRQPDRGDLVS